MQVDVGQLRELRIARVHAAHVTAERYLPSLRVGRIVEVVVTLRVFAERRVVRMRSKRQRRPAAPAADQLGRKQFPLFVRACVGLEEAIERADARLILAKADVGAVSPKHVGLRYRIG